MTSDVLVVVLAGGAGSRIGGAKPERLLGGRRLIDHALGHARRYGRKVAVAVRDTVPEGLTGLMLLRDPPGIAGPLAGLAAGCAEAEQLGLARVLLLPSDMPFLPPDLAERLGAALDENPGAGAAQAHSGGRDHPVCSLWRTGAAGALADYAAAGKSSLKGLAARVGAVTVAWPDDPFFNINDAEALDRAERLLER